jgi:hypothetical protein
MEMMRREKICDAGNKNDCADYGKVIVLAVVCVRKLITNGTEKGKREENIRGLEF